MLPLVRAIQLQRLRNISQNSRAIAVYPSMNGSRFEHALGTMHLASEAWKSAWISVWGSGNESSSKVRHQFCTEVFEFLVGHFDEDPDDVDSYWSYCGFHKDRSVDDVFKRFEESFEETIDLTVSVVALVHDIGHPPFSHVLEDVFARNMVSLFGKEFAAGFKPYVDEVRGGPAQFHEYAGSVIFDEMLKDDDLFGRLPRLLIKKVFDARGDTGTWDSCLHHIIDDQIDVDRLDYTVRDAKRAGIRLLRN